jgi:aryl-alcohol dehydrogenase-like predicted oxidoreductase
MERRMLGSSGIEVTALALGSWRTFERIPREQGLAVMAAAREHGIAFLDDARYDDEAGTAPIRTGYSEVVFGELFRATGWRRDEVVVANKLWWEFWPGQTAAEEIDASLRRMGLDHLDLVYSEVPPAGLRIDVLVRDVAALVAAGKARAWGVLNWPPELLVEAAEVARTEGLPAPCAAQLAYNLVLRDRVESAQARAALASADASVVASMPLWFGSLTGKYAAGRGSGRLAGSLDSERLRTALDTAPRLAELASELGTTPAALAIAFTLADGVVASALFGATRPEQVAENVTSLEVLARLTPGELERLRAIGT